MTRYIPVWVENKVVYVNEDCVKTVSVNEDGTLNLEINTTNSPNTIWNANTVKDGHVCESIAKVRPTYRSMLTSNPEIRRRVNGDD